MKIADRIMAAVSPAARNRQAIEAYAERAAQALARQRQAARAYAAGKPRLGQKYWKAPPTGPRAEIETGLQMMRDRARQMVRDNPYAARGVSVLVAHQIGTGIVARIGDAMLQEAWNEWAKRCDHDGMHDLGGLMALAARTMSEGGEALIRLRVISQAEARRRGLTIPLTLQVMEGDMLPISTTYLPRPGRVENGIELAEDGTRIAYHIRKHHPGELRRLGEAPVEDLERVPADQIIHLFRMTRPGQLRGVPDLAPVLLRMKQLDDYEDATLETAKAQSLLGVFVTGPEDLDEPDGGTASQPAFELYPGMVHNLPHGSEPRFLTPSGAGGFEPFALHSLMGIATGMGTTYDQMTGDLRQANYSSLRAGKIEFRRKVEQDQWQLFIPRMCMPIYAAFYRLASIRISVTTPPKVEWMPPRFEMIDPYKEISAAVMAVRSGFETWEQVVASFGYDPDEQADAIARSNQRFDDRGLILDVDPRRVAVAGNAHDAAQLAAVEIDATGAASPRQPAQQEPP